MPLRRLSFPSALVAAVALTVPAAAMADHGPAYTDPVFTRYLEVASAHWAAPTPTCVGPDQQPIQPHAVLYDDPDAMVAARAEEPGCRIWLDRDYWPRPLDEVDCMVVAHEWGHLLGHSHSEDRDSLMYEEPTAGAPGCAMLAQAARPTASSPGRRATRQAKSHLKHARKRARSHRGRRALRARSCRRLAARRRVALRAARTAAARRKVARRYRLRKARCAKRAARKHSRRR